MDLRVNVTEAERASRSAAINAELTRLRRREYLWRTRTEIAAYAAIAGWAGLLALFLMVPSC